VTNEELFLRVLGDQIPPQGENRCPNLYFRVIYYLPRSGVVCVCVEFVLHILSMRSREMFNLFKKKSTFNVVVVLI
jgi:hypothetical protein